MPMPFLKKLQTLLEMIKFEHTIFALPFALSAAIVAAKGFPPWGTLGWILLAMIGARAAAMGFNRIVDAKIDAANPRTRTRAIPAGQVSFPQAWGLVIISTLLFIFAAAMLNTLALILSPVALVIILGYSYTKRFTSFSHLVLGLALGLAPIGAWIAVRGMVELPAIVLAGAVMLWTAGFDIIYALQDIKFDKSVGLFSIPRKLGAARALIISLLMHALMIVLLMGFGLMTGGGIIYYLGVLIVAICIFYEHTLVSPKDLSRVNAAFFTMNGLVSVGYFLFTCFDVLVK